jgi:hypothetical protein
MRRCHYDINTYISHFRKTELQECPLALWNKMPQSPNRMLRIKTIIVRPKQRLKPRIWKPADFRPGSKVSLKEYCAAKSGAARIYLFSPHKTSGRTLAETGTQPPVYNPIYAVPCRDKRLFWRLLQILSAIPALDMLAWDVFTNNSFR